MVIVVYNQRNIRVIKLLFDKLQVIFPINRYCATHTVRYQGKDPGRFISLFTLVF